MKISLHSDIHFNNHSTVSENIFPTVPEADVILLAGDIADKSANLLKHFVRETKVRNPTAKILFIPGNHEFYGQDFDEHWARLKKLEDKIDDFHFIDNRFVEIDGVEFIGSTLWTSFSLISAKDKYEWAFAMGDITRSIADFHTITAKGRRITPNWMIDRFEESYRFIEDRLMNSTAEKKVILTHFSPHTELYNVAFKGHQLTPYFITDCSDLFRLKPDYWCWGHTHCNHFDKTSINGVRCLTNQRGYNNEQTGYKPGYVVEI